MRNQPRCTDCRRAVFILACLEKCSGDLARCSPKRQGLSSLFRSSSGPDAVSSRYIYAEKRPIAPLRRLLYASLFPADFSPGYSGEQAKLSPHLGLRTLEPQPWIVSYSYLGIWLFGTFKSSWLIGKLFLSYIFLPFNIYRILKKKRWATVNFSLCCSVFSGGSRRGFSWVG